MRIAVIIPAAGSSRRFLHSGGMRTKLSEDLAGKSVLHRTVEVFSKFDHPDAVISQIVVAGPADPEAFSEFKDQHSDRLALLGAQLCQGGAESRAQSVQHALERVDSTATHIAVHDAARPCLGLGLLDRLFETAQRYPAVVPGVPVADTLKQISDTGETMGSHDPLDAILGVSESSRAPLMVVDRTIDRTNVVQIQTPQVFDAALLRRAYSQSDVSSTDDAGLVERLGERVVVIQGDVRNIKITYPGDLEIARAILGLKAPEGRATNKKF